MGEGASYLTVPIAQALPKPPDVAVAGHVPGGQLIRCTPEGTAEVTRRSQYLVSFPFRQGVAVTIRRIHVDLPLLLAEDELEKTTLVTKQRLLLPEPEKKEWLEAKPGRHYEREDRTAIGYERPYEQTVTKTTYRTLPEISPETVEEEENTTTSRSVLPITVTILVQLNGPEGELWAQSFDVPLHYVYGAMGAAVGTGHVATYADLVNPITIDPDKIYGLQLYVLVPTTVKTNIQVGTIAEGETIKVGEGEIRFFYDLETVPVGK